MSTLHVENLKGLSSGSNANKIIVPSGQTLTARSCYSGANAGWNTSFNTTSTSYVTTGHSVTITLIAKVKFF